jgi:hypothetical protein
MIETLKNIKSLRNSTSNEVPLKILTATLSYVHFLLMPYHIAYPTILHLQMNFKVLSLNIFLMFKHHRDMAEILPKRRKTPNQSINAAALGL